MESWQEQSSFIGDKCVCFVITKYSGFYTIVFDRYPFWATVSRQKNGIGPKVAIGASSNLAVSNEEFFSNNMNKDLWICCLKDSSILV